jgi:hypothetical protein
MIRHAAKGANCLPRVRWIRLESRPNVLQKGKVAGAYRNHLVENLLMEEDIVSSHLFLRSSGQNEPDLQGELSPDSRINEAVAA